jgi:hypothetical protein
MVMRLPLASTGFRITQSLLSVAVVAVLLSGCIGGSESSDEQNLCDLGEGWVDVFNASGRSGSVEIVESSSGVVLATATFPASNDRGEAPDSMLRLRVPVGLITARTTVENGTVSPETVAVSCDRDVQLTVRLQGSLQLPTPETTPIAQIPRHVLEELLDRPRLPGTPWDDFRQDLTCQIQRSDEALIDRLLRRSDWMPSAVLSRLLANEEYLENFLATYFPDSYAEADGDAIEVIPMHLDFRIPVGPLVDAYEFRIKPQFRFLNNGHTRGGVVLHARFPEADDYRAMERIAIFPEPDYTHSSVMIEQIQLEGRDFGLEGFDYLVWKNYPAPTEAYELGFTKREPCFPDHLYASYRFGFRIGREPEPLFGSWNATDDFSAQCLVRRLRMAIHGRSDFLRRKLLDLNPGRPASSPFPLSGQDELVWEEPGDGTFIINYSGQYDCPREYIF